MIDLWIFIHRLRLVGLGNVLFFWEFKAYGAPYFFGKKDPIAIKWWIVDMENA